jgi:hypothetical protein
MNEEESISRGSETLKKPEGWTKDEKYNLYQALKVYGSNNIEQIRLVLHKKSTEEIQEIINYYKKTALKRPSVAERQKNRILNNLSRVPLALWGKYLTDSLNYTELQTETANALRIIAECENIPSAAGTGNIDFRLIYNAIANAMEGKALPDNSIINNILQCCIVETAYTSKSFIKNSSLRRVMNSIDLEEKEVSVYNRPTDNHELGTIRHLASQKNYNPLNITEEFLKPSFHNKATNE